MSKAILFCKKVFEHSNKSKRTYSKLKKIFAIWKFWKIVLKFEYFPLLLGFFFFVGIGLMTLSNSSVILSVYIHGLFYIRLNVFFIVL